MGLKEKVVGLLLIILGAWPFLLGVESVKTYFASYKFLEVLTPGEVVYQVVLIVLGVLLFLKIRQQKNIYK